MQKLTRIIGELLRIPWSTPATPFDIEEMQALLLIGQLKMLKVFVFSNSVTAELIVSNINRT